MESVKLPKESSRSDWTKIELAGSCLIVTGMCLVMTSHLLLLSILSSSRRWNISTRLQCSSRQDIVSMIPWEMGKQLLRDITVVDALALSRLNQGSFRSR